ncbi:hypothetical protein V2S84_20360 [Azotobacter chroococcum]|nr:hypothetical protein [Azotobacter chroococcum]
MKKLYLDYNIISYLRAESNPDLKEAYDKASISHTTVFSPAHLEDIAVSEMRDKTDISIVKSEIAFLSEIAKRNALRPVTRNNVVLYDESPDDCYARVKAHYDNNDYAEAIDAAVIKDAHQNPAGHPREANNIPPDQILNHISYRELISLSLLKMQLISKSEIRNSLFWTFSDIKNRFSVFETHVNMAANFLEKLGYYREPESKSRSRLHDVSHIIYAAYCDTFVSSDNKILKKAAAIYSMLQVPTKILSLNEFISTYKPQDNSAARRIDNGATLSTDTNGG